MCKKNFIPISICFSVIGLQNYRDILKTYRKRAITFFFHKIDVWCFWFCCCLELLSYGLILWLPTCFLCKNIISSLFCWCVYGAVLLRKISLFYSNELLADVGVHLEITLLFLLFFLGLSIFALCVSPLLCPLSFIAFSYWAFDLSKRSLSQEMELSLFSTDFGTFFKTYGGGWILYQYIVFCYFPCCTAKISPY